MKKASRPHRRRPWPKQGKEANVLPEELKSAYEGFYDATKDNGHFDAKTTVMIQLAAAFAIGCYP
jgi:hypothetical protein